MNPLVGLGLGSLAGNMVGGLSSLFGDRGKKQLEAALQVLSGVQTPTFDYSQITPAMLQLAGLYSPETYGAQIQGPASMLEEDPALAAQQAEQLAQLEQIQGQGMTEADRNALQALAMGTSAQASGMTQAGLESLQQQGILGGGAQATLRGMANQSAMNRMRQGGADIAQARLQNQLGAIGMGGQIAGQMRGQSMQTGMANQDALNRFNEWASNLATQAQADAAASRERAGFANVGEGQRIADYNAQNRQATQTSNLERTNRLRDMDFQNQMAKAQAQANAYMNQGSFNANRAAARDQSLGSLFGALGGLAGYGAAGGFGGGGQPYAPANPFTSYDGKQNQWWM